MTQPLPATASSRPSTQVGTRSSSISSQAKPPPTSQASSTPSPTSAAPADVTPSLSSQAAVGSSATVNAGRQSSQSPSSTSSSWTAQRSQPSRLPASQDWLGGAQSTATGTRSQSEDVLETPILSSPGALGRTSSSRAASVASEPTPSDSSKEAGDGNAPVSEEHDGLGQGGLAGSVAGVVAAILLISLIAWLCLRARRRHNNAKEGTSRVSDPNKQQRSSFGENTGTMPWTDFVATSPEPEKTEFAEKHLADDVSVDGMAIQLAPLQPDCYPTASPDHGQISNWRRTVPVPPPSMRSKRTSAMTATTDAHTVDTNVHTLDSSTQLIYPAKRPVSSSLSFGYESPKKGPSARASWSTQAAPKVPETPPEPSSDGHELLTPSISRTSTMTDVSLGAVGRRSRYMIGRAL